MSKENELIRYLCEIRDIEDLSSLDFKIKACGIEEINKTLSIKPLYIAEKSFRLFKYLYESELHTTLFAQYKHPYVHSDPSTFLYLLLKGYDINLASESGQNAIFYATPERIMSLIESGINIFALNNYNENALFRVKDTGVLKELIKIGVNTNQISDNGSTVLFRNDITKEKIKLFLDSGTDGRIKTKNGCDFLSYFYKNNKYTSIDILETAIEYNLPVLESCIPLNGEYSGKDEENLLFIIENETLIEKYKDKFINVLNNVNYKGENAIFYSENPLKTSKLIEWGIETNLKNKAGENASFNSNYLSNIKLMMPFLKDEINQTNSKGENILTNKKLGQWEIIKYLIENGADYTERRSDFMNISYLAETIIKKEKNELNNNMDLSPLLLNKSARI